MKKKLRKRKLLAEIDSAGFEDFHLDDRADPRSVQIATKHGIDITDHRARLFTVEDFDRFDRIYVMDLGNYSDVIQLARTEADRNKVVLILDTIYPGQYREVPDPYYRGKEGFEKVYHLLDLACGKIADQLKKGQAKN